MAILDIALRSVISFIMLFVLAKMMGKKQISQLTFFDYVIGISIGSIAAAFAIDNSINYEHGIVGLIIYATFALLLSILTLKNNKAREVISGTPTILIQNGKIIEENLKKSMFHLNDLLEECRIKGAYNIDDVEYAILETCGQMSILLKPEKKPLTAKDMNIPMEYEGIVADLIIDGVIMHKHLKLIGKNEKWLYKELSRQKISSVEEVLLARYDASGKFTVQKKSDDPTPMDVIE